jgi:ferredoxin
MKIIADRSRCAGHARCASVAAPLFELDDNGYIGMVDVIVRVDDVRDRRAIEQINFGFLHFRLPGDLGRFSIVDSVSVLY